MNLITLSHGSGGEMTNKLVHDLFYRYFENDYLKQQNDATLFHAETANLAISTDSFVITPPVFPGGDIGKLAVCGTINDVAMSGAEPICLTAAFILEEGLEIELLEQVVKSMAETAKAANVPIICGDTKVVPRGKADKIFINTTGIGKITRPVTPSGNGAKPGDAVLISGTIGDHGAAIMSCREGLEFDSEMQSDCACLHTMIANVLDEGINVRVLRDPTRGGLAATLNEIAEQSNCGIELEEEAIPTRENVKNFCEILGLDPLSVANEGKVLIFVPEEEAEKTVNILKKHTEGEEATIIGKVVDNKKASVSIRGILGSTRPLRPPVGELLPRIC